MLLLPPTDEPRSSVQELDIAHCSCACDAVGGDYYDIIPVGDEDHSRRLLVAIGDVTGHGVPAALVMRTARGILRSRAQSCTSPAELLTHLNDLLVHDIAPDCFMTMQIGQIDLDRGEMTWAGAGHDPVLRFDPQIDCFAEIRARGLPLGIEPSVEYLETRYDGLTPGQILALGTDGIWETQNPDGRMFGKERLRQAIRAASDGSAADILASVREGVKAFRASAARRDDISLVIIKATPGVEATRFG